MAKAKLTWVNPTTRVDGSPLAPADIASIDIVDNSSGGPVQIGNVPGDSTTFTTDTLDVGTHFFVVFVRDTLGHVSDRSNVFVITVPPALAAPSPATNLDGVLID